MIIRVVTLFPEMLASLRAGGVVAKALQSGIVQLECINPHDFAPRPFRQVDDKPYGGGAGIVMKPEPLAAAIDRARSEVPSAPVLALSPCGVRFDDALARKMSAWKEVIFVAGRYQGIDERIFESRIDGCVSIGSFVVSGGELPAMVVIDALMRHIPGVIGSEESVGVDSFAVPDKLAPPCYTRPALFEGMHVPKELLSGNHDLIKQWRNTEAQKRTVRWQQNQNFEEFSSTDVSRQSK